MRVRVRQQTRESRARRSANMVAASVVSAALRAPPLRGCSDVPVPERSALVKNMHVFSKCRCLLCTMGLVQANYGLVKNNTDLVNVLVNALIETIVRHRCI